VGPGPDGGDVSLAGEVVTFLTDGDNWTGTFGIPNRLTEHLSMSGAAVAAALAIGLPLGIALGHYGRGGVVAINVANVGRALPSYALLVIGLSVLGDVGQTAFVALVALAIPPVVTNSYVGVREVEAEVREAARGMGMTGAQLLRRVELPMAMPLIMAGVRTASVQVVATATLAAVISWGGLGRFVVDGFYQQDYPEMIAGSVLVAVLAILTEVALGGLQRLTVSPGLRGDERAHGEDLATAVSAGAVQQEAA
jgi:osmoprotectant transport system permease protein